MTPIHQIYCTHCTYGSSALEQREGELAERVLGYSARAGSMERNELRGYYRQVERFLYYYLPSDSPPDERVKLDAATAPSRMFFSPSIGRLQMLGQVVYRRHDTAGRAGSYFAHVLFGEWDTTPWPVLDCLRLWDASWVIEDAPELPKRLPTLESLDELRQGRRAAIDDDLLLNFLTTSPGEAFDDPRRVIPERWRSTTLAERTELLIDVAQGYIELGSNRRDSVLLVCEPSLAALVFYGVARLLPKGAVREGVSFSTYEPSPDRLPMALAATTFHAPDTIDLKPEAYRRRGYAYNTFLQTRSAAGPPGGTYARLLIETLLAKGWPAVDLLLDDFALAGCGKLEELESLAQTHCLAPRLLDPAATVDPSVWTRTAVAERYLGAAVERQLSALAPDGSQLRALIGSPRQMLVVELAARTGAESSPSARFLLRSVPPEHLNEVFSSQRIAREAKVETLAFHLSNTGRIPEGCESLWLESTGAVNRIGTASPPILSAALARLSQPALVSLQKSLSDERVEAFVVVLARACPIEPSRQAALVRFMAEVVAALDEQRLIVLLSRYRTELQTSYPKPEPLLAHRLSKLLYELPDRPREFFQRLEALSGWVDHFPEPGLAEQRLAHWRKVYSILQSLADGDAKKSGGLFKGKAKPDYKGLAEALRKAMPEAVYSDDLAGTMKKKRLRELGTQIVGCPDFMPPAVWNTMTRYFEYRDWADSAKKSAVPGRSPTGKPFPKRGGKSKRRPQGGGWFGRWIILVAIGLGCALGMVILGSFRSATNPPAVAETTDGPGRETTGEQDAESNRSKSAKEKHEATKARPVAGQDATTKHVKSVSTSRGPKLASPPANEPTDAMPVGPPDDPGSSPDSEPASDSSAMSDTQEKPEATDIVNPPDSPSSQKSHDGPRSNEAALGETNAVEAPQHAMNLSFPPADSFKLVKLTDSLPASGTYELNIFRPPKDTLYQDNWLFVASSVDRPNDRPLCSLPKKQFEQHVKAKPSNWLGMFEVSPDGLAFKWTNSKSEAGCRKWFCEQGFVLQITTDESPLFYALYETKRVAAVEINPTMRSGAVKGLEALIEARQLRLGAGRVYFSDKTIREFSEAPNGHRSVLKPGAPGTNAAPIDVHLERSRTGSGDWTVKLVSKKVATTTVESEDGVNAPETEATPTAPTTDSGAPKVGKDAPTPKYVSATLYRVVEIDDGTKVRLDEVSIEEPSSDSRKGPGKAKAKQTPDSGKR